MRTTPRRRATLLCLAGSLCLVAGCSTVARAAEGHPDWQKLEDVEVIDVLTQDEDGDLRESKVWFVLVDGAPYLRTSRSAWLDNIVRGSEVKLRIEGLEYRVGAVVVEGQEVVEKVDAASQEKYGLQEDLIRVFRMRKPDILRIVRRP